MPDQTGDPFANQTVVNKRNLGANPNVRAQLGTFPRFAVTQQSLPNLLSQAQGLEGVELDPFAAFNIAGGALRSALQKDVEDLLAGLAGNTPDGQRDLTAMLGQVANVTQIQEQIRRNKAQERLAVLDRTLQTLPALMQARQRPEINRPFANVINQQDPFAGALEGLRRMMARREIAGAQKDIGSDRAGVDGLLSKITAPSGQAEPKSEEPGGEKPKEVSLEERLKAAKDQVEKSKIITDDDAQTRPRNYIRQSNNGAREVTVEIPIDIKTPKTIEEAQAVGIVTRDEFVPPPLEKSQREYLEGGDDFRRIQAQAKARRAKAASEDMALPAANAADVQAEIERLLDAGKPIPPGLIGEAAGIFPPEFISRLEVMNRQLGAPQSAVAQGVGY